MKLIDQNRKKFRTDGVRIIIEGLAPQALEGTGNTDTCIYRREFGKLTRDCPITEKVKSDVRIVINAISLETVSEVMGLVDEGFSQMRNSASECSKIKGSWKISLMMGQNPVYIISAGGRKPGQV